MNEEFGPKKRRVLERSPWVLAFAALPLLLSLCAALIDHAHRAPQYVVAGWAIMLWGLLRNPWARVRAQTVRAGPEGLELGSRVLGREEIRLAVVIPAHGSHPVRVRIKPTGARLPIEVEVTDVTEGRALQRALGHDVTQAAEIFHVGSAVVGSARRILGAGLVALAVGAAIALPAALLGLEALFALAPFIGILAFFALLAWPARLLVGADGLLQRWLFWKRFIAYGDVAVVVPYCTGGSEHLRVHLRSNEVLVIPILSSGLELGRGAALEERIDEARRAWQGGGADAASTARLERSGRSLPDWILALRTIGAGADADMRHAPLPRDLLWRIVEDPQADREARAAAAVALGAGADEDRARLRVIAATTAAPRLRIALEVAADSGMGRGDDALLEALAAVDEEAALRGAAR